MIYFSRSSRNLTKTVRKWEQENALHSYCTFETNISLPENDPETSRDAGDLELVHLGAADDEQVPDREGVPDVDGPERRDAHVHLQHALEAPGLCVF